MTVQHHPACGRRSVHRRGDVLELRLTVTDESAGHAYVRCNLNSAAVRRAEIVAHAESHQPMLARDWHDVPMARLGAGRFVARLPLLETGLFEAKAFFLPDGGKPVWPAGENLRIKVLPAYTVCANSVYTAFPRQFGAAIAEDPRTQEMADAEALLDEWGYSVIPRSGTFRDLLHRLDVIMDRMGFRIVQLLPVHPVPTTFARMGRFGSPFASRDFFSVDPAMAEFDRKTTPMEQFEELVDGVHGREGFIFLDLPINHTGWASWLQLHHPEWFKRGDGGSFVNPGAWGVVWEDLCALDFRQRGLWMYLSEVFLHWCRRGVDGFRCDAGYMIPVPVWRYITSKVREQFPDTVFLLEGLGGPHSTAERLVAEGGLDWAYSEMFQSESADSIRECLDLTTRFSQHRGLMVHFAETHDNDRLAAVSRRHARFRCALTALLSHDGAFGITNGVEWYATEKLRVHGASPLNWGAAENQVDHMERLNRLLATHPAFAGGVSPQFTDTAAEETIAVLRKPEHAPGVLVLANVSSEHERTVAWRLPHIKELPDRLLDLVSGDAVPVRSVDGRHACKLGPEQVVCLQLEHVEMPRISHECAPDRVLNQRLQAMALELYVLRHGFGHVEEGTARTLAADFGDSPEAFVTSLFEDTGYVPVVHWRTRTDTRRIVMVPPGHILMIHAPDRFRVSLRDEERTLRQVLCIPEGDSGYTACLLPVDPEDHARDLNLDVRTFGQNPGHHRVRIRLLSNPPEPTLRLHADAEALRRRSAYALCTGPVGEMAQVQGRWGEITSQYDAFLASNDDDTVPVDRRVLLSRLRAWIVYRDYSQDVTVECQTDFSTDLENRVRWTFDVPVGMGVHAMLHVLLDMNEAHNRVRVTFARPRANGRSDILDDQEAVTLIVRPDVEDRSVHETTRAMDGPETRFPRGTAVEANGFRFDPFGRGALNCHTAQGDFVWEPEWAYMVPHPVEASRGLDRAGDLFSPGYFRMALKGGEQAALDASAGDTPVPTWSEDLNVVHEMPFEEAARRALSRFVVQRNDSRTVIAGYPWFLDWGRDTLICLRGIIEAGMLEQARDILREFASFEKQGTLPNMIRGKDDSNRDTSDAGLWLFVAVNDYLRKTQSDEILAMDCAGRSLEDVLVDLGTHLLEGTPNGIRVDTDSGMLFSPAHFTWMDTNHPAGTPRQGYPVEIQALWFAALQLLERCAPERGPWRHTGENLRDAVRRLFVLPDRRGLSDCLHADPGETASQATADDACRPNQLLAVTLGLIQDEALRRAILTACEQLLVPGGIRSLADARVSFPLRIERDGDLLNNPEWPYWGRYEGDEDTRRKPAYHNGTAWSWLFASYPEAMMMTYGKAARSAARALLLSMIPIMRTGCLGHIPEIVDGDVPHSQRGCGAQAWGISELLRVYLTVEGNKQQ